MTYREEGLGITIARSAADAVRAFQQQVQSRPTVTTAPAPAPQLRAAPTVIRTVFPTTPVIRTLPQTRTAYTVPPTLRPVLPAPTPVKGQPQGKAGVMPVVKLPPQKASAALKSPTQSPLLLIGVALAALYLLNRR